MTHEYYKAAFDIIMYRAPEILINHKPSLKQLRTTQTRKDEKCILNGWTCASLKLSAGTCANFSETATLPVEK